MRKISACLLLGLPLCALPQSFVPKELDGWQSWVLADKPFLRCPFFANTDGTRKENRLCALPGRLSLELTPSGGRFTQTWVTYSPGFIPLPGNNDNWPAGVAVNGAPAAVVSREGIPQLYVGPGTYAVTGQFMWTHRPESLAVPAEAGLLSLVVDGLTIDQLDRADNAIWLGRHRGPEVAQQMDVEVYRLLSDGIPLRLDTRIVLRITGDPREETLPSVLPGHFEATALHGPLPAHLGPDGSLRLQARAGNWTVLIAARAPESLAEISLPAAQGSWPKLEIWSYRSNDRLRVAGIEGVEGVDPAQANVPPDWRTLPSYRVAAGGMLRIAEHNRGSLSQETNHLNLHRDLYLDFSHRGFTVVDTIDGQMRTDWRLDMRPPFTLAHARLGTNDILVTQGPGDATGVEIRSPEIKLSALARVDRAGGALLATGWNSRFDQVNGTLTLPPGHRLLVALGADRAPGAWVERWSLMDIFLVVLASAVAFRLFGVAYAAIAFVGMTLVQQENAFLVWGLLFALATLVLFRQVPEGRFSAFSRWLHYAALALLLLQWVPFTIEQVRFAFYPQLADPGWTRGSQALEDAKLANAARNSPAPAPAAPPQFSSSASQFQKALVDEPSGLVARSVGSVDLLQLKDRYAPGALVQAGPGIPEWQYVRYEYGWTGPVDAAQTVRFVILSPALVGAWRIAGLALVIAVFLRMTRADRDLRTIGRRWFRAPGLVLPLAFAAYFGGGLLTPGWAAETPDKSLLDELKTRLTQPSACVPDCADTTSAQLAIETGKFAITLSIAALADVAVTLPTLGQRTDPDAISVDGNPVAGAYRDPNQQLWIALKPGMHSVKILGRLPPADAVAVLFPQVPHRMTVTAPGWDVSGIAGDKLLGNTLQLTRQASTVREGDVSQAADGLSPFVRVTRAFTLALDWSVMTQVERIAPERGGFTLQIPLLTGESVLTAGLDTHGGTQVSASFDTDANDFRWDSALSKSDGVELQAPKDKPWNEIWTFRISPMWRVAFDGTPAVLPETVQRSDWIYEYHPRAGEHLKLWVSRPVAIAGETLAIDTVNQSIIVGRRTRDTVLTFTYRSTQGNPHSVGLPAGARLTGVSVDGAGVPLRAENGQVRLALIPGTHQVQIRWQSGDAAGVFVRSAPVDLQVASSNVETTLQVGQRWVLFAGGPGVGPAILYWGELAVFAVLAVLLGRSRRTPLRTHEWLLLGLGLSTFSWFVLLLVVVWMAAVRWRTDLNVQAVGPGSFKVLQAAFIGWSLAAVFGLVLAIPYGLLASPNMRIAGAGQSLGSLSWFTDQAANQLPGDWVISVSLWWYKSAMLAWALWLAFALTRWLPIAWRALNVGALWEINPTSDPSP
jgi:hypothetical protein